MVDNGISQDWKKLEGFAREGGFSEDQIELIETIFYAASLTVFKCIANISSDESCPKEESARKIKAIHWEIYEIFKNIIGRQDRK